MTSDEIKSLLKRTPFRPFRIVASSGVTYEVTNPDLVVVMKSEVFIAFPGEDRWAFVPLLHVAGVETFHAA